MESNHKEILRFIIIAVIMTVFIISSIFIYKSILLPSYLSYAAVCYDDGDKIIEDNGYLIGGKVEYVQQQAFFTENRTIPNTKLVYNMTLYFNDSTIYKHELIHVNQLYRGFPDTSCDNKPAKILSELEAYTMSRMPDFIFYRLYDRY